VIGAETYARWIAVLDTVLASLDPSAVQARYPLACLSLQFRARQMGALAFGEHNQ
jgi:hypothetical protein